MAERRRNQPALKDLNHFSRFLNHLCAEKNLTQAAVASRLPGMSTSTVSRLFRGQAQPTESELSNLAQIFKIPITNFKALQILDAASDAPMLGTINAWRNLMDGSGRRLLMSGATLAGGILALRDAPLSGKLLLISIADPGSSQPERVSPLVDFEKQTDGCESGWLRLSWLLTVSTVLSASQRSKCHCRLWVRPTLRTPVVVGAEASIGHLVANDWIAFEADTPSGFSDFHVHFFNEPGWRRSVQPVIDRLEGDLQSGGETLIWDSRWTPAERHVGRLRERLEAALKEVQTERLLALCMAQQSVGE